MTVPYQLWEQVSRLIEHQVTVEYTDVVKVIFRLKSDDCAAFSAKIIDLTNGQVNVLWLGTELYRALD
jgi:chorismate mutase